MVFIKQICSLAGHFCWSYTVERSIVGVMDVNLICHTYV